MSFHYEVSKIENYGTEPNQKKKNPDVLLTAIKYPIMRHSL